MKVYFQIKTIRKNPNISASVIIEPSRRKTNAFLKLSPRYFSAKYDQVNNVTAGLHTNKHKRLVNSHRHA